LLENKPYKAYYILKECKSESSRYKFAVTCIRLNKFKEAESHLVMNNSIPNGSYGLYLMGVLNEK